MMNVANMIDSSATATFSARRRSQRAIVTACVIMLPVHQRWGMPPARSGRRLRDGRRLLDGVVALGRALRPVAAVFVDVALLREGAEGALVRRVDLLAVLLE